MTPFCPLKSLCIWSHASLNILVQQNGGVHSTSGHLEEGAVQLQFHWQFSAIQGLMTLCKGFWVTAGKLLRKTEPVEMHCRLLLHGKVCRQINFSQLLLAFQTNTSPYTVGLNLLSPRQTFLNNRPFPGFLVPLFQNKSMCKIFLMTFLWV